MGSEKKFEVEVSWKRGVSSEINIRNFKLLTDAPKEDGGNDLGPTSAELFLASQGSCYVAALYKVAKEMHIALKNFKLKIAGIKELGETPRFSKIKISVKIEAENARRDVLLKLCSLAEKKCTVTNTLKIKPEISFFIE